jgi:hypothetical protein
VKVSVKFRYQLYCLKDWKQGKIQSHLTTTGC